MSRGYDRYAVAIEVENVGRLIRLEDDYMHLVERVELHQVWDGADELRLVCRAENDQREPKIVGERILEPGSSVVLRAGYGRTLTPVGRFDIYVHEPTYQSGSVSYVDLIGSDGFQRLHDNTWPSDLGKEPQTYTDAAKILARKFGMGIAADVSRKIPHRTRTRRVRVGTSTTRAGKKVRRYRRRTVHTKMIKNAGDSDAKMLKHLANYSGFLGPKVRWVEAGSDLEKQLKKGHDVVEGTANRDVLLFRRANVQRQVMEAGAFKFVRRHKSGAPSTLDSFQPRWDTDGVPIAVRVTGVVIGKPAGRRRRRRRQIVTVEAELVGPQVLRERSALLRQAARTTDPVRSIWLSERAAGLTSKVAVTKVRRRKFGKQDRKRFRNASTTLIEVLDKDRRPGLEYDPRKKRRVQTMRREALRTTVVFREVKDLQDMAKQWLMTRLQLHITATASAHNLPGLERVYPFQIHEFVVGSPEYDGHYMVMMANHTWSATDGHRCIMTLERVAEAPSDLQTRTTSESI